MNTHWLRAYRWQQLVVVVLVLGQHGTARAAAFLPTQAMTEPRYRHTATRLVTGQVLVAGGGWTSTELYDPTTAKWRTAGEMTTVHQNNAAVLLFGGKVLLTGGEDNSFISQTNAEVFDPATETWSPTGGLNTPRGMHTATILGTGKVLVAGGSADGMHGLASAELYDPDTGVWTVTSPMRTARFRHTATLMQDGRVLVAGGLDKIGFTSTAIAIAEIYDPSTATWATSGSLNVAHYQHTSTLMPNGQVLVVGGYNTKSGFLSTCELFDPAKNSWRTTGSLNVARDEHSATLLSNGKVLTAGGVGLSPSYYALQLASAEIYDPTTGAWSMTSSLNTGRFLQTATLLPNGQDVLIAGGGDYNQGLIFSTAELYVPGAQTVTLTNSKRPPDNTFQFTFSYTPGSVGQVLCSTNPAFPLTQWSVLGDATEISPGQFQFTDLQAPSNSSRFYRIGPP